MLEFYDRAKSYLEDTELSEELKPRVSAVFNKCVSFIKEAQKKSEETTIFYLPFLSW